jgi:DNA-binding Lrp family transcriptional regulator
MPLSAYIFLETEAGKAMSVAKRVTRIKGVKYAHTVTGPYDIIVFVEAQDTTELLDMIVKRIQNISGVMRTLTSVVV